MADDPICEECGYSVYSAEHMRGVGLHGHVRTSKAEADRQRHESPAQETAKGVATASGRAEKGN